VRFERLVWYQCEPLRHKNFRRFSKRDVAFTRLDSQSVVSRSGTVAKHQNAMFAAVPNWYIRFGQHPMNDNVSAMEKLTFNSSMLWSPGQDWGKPI
jgi:hypothetical protein